jgi:hypothetical protein
MTREYFFSAVCSSTLQVVHVRRRELERTFEIVLLAKNARMEVKSCANES